MSHRVLIFGANGQIGSAVCRLAAERDLDVIPSTRQQCDHANLPELLRVLNEGQFDSIINCAGYTKVDAAESNFPEAMAVNVDAVGAIARECARRNVPFLHLSTDYVFGGDKGVAYREDDEKNPINAYGRSKHLGEQAVGAAGGQAIILRTAWVMGRDGANFAKTILSMCDGVRDSAGVVGDQFGSPTSAEDVAEAILQLHNRAIANEKFSGVWHFANAGVASWHEVAALIFGKAKAFGKIVPVLNSISTEEFLTAAKRPVYSVLATEKFSHDLDTKIRPWQDSIGEITSYLLENDV